MKKFHAKAAKKKQRSQSSYFRDTPYNKAFLSHELFFALLACVFCALCEGKEEFQISVLRSQIVFDCSIVGYNDVFPIKRPIKIE